MNVTAIINQLTDERNRIDEAIKLLSGMGTSTDGTAPKTRKKRKPLSADARKRIAAAQRKRWAAQKAKK